MKTKQSDSQLNLNKEIIADLSSIGDLSNLTELYLVVEFNKMNDVKAGAYFATTQESCRFDTYCC